MRYHFLRFPEGREKALTFSYDDGCRQDIRFAEILTKYNLKGTFNINSGRINGQGGKGSLNIQEIKDFILLNGHEIAVHGKDHIAPGNAPAKDGIRDVLNCKEELEKAFSSIIRGMAYPDTGIRQITNLTSLNEIKSYLKMLGIVYSRTLGGDNNAFKMPTDWLEWMPTAHHNNPKLMEYLDEFINNPLSEYHANNSPKLFYLWGHSYEFDMQNNWEVIEEFCKAASNNPKIWYATNIEIYDYWNAYNSLVFSTDNTLVYNPSLYEVWFWVDGKTYSIKSGETLEIK